MIDVKILNAFVPSPNMSQILQELESAKRMDYRGMSGYLSLPPELKRVLSKAEDIYHRYIGNIGKTLHWHHRMTSATIHFTNESGEYYLDVTAFQMALPFAWNETKDKI